MTTFDFTGYYNPGSDPRRSAGLMLASQIDLDSIAIDMASGPKSGGGFWNATMPDGRRIRFFGNVPDLRGREPYQWKLRLLQHDAALSYGLLQVGYTEDAQWVEGS